MSASAEAFRDVCSWQSGCVLPPFILSGTRETSRAALHRSVMEGPAQVMGCICLRQLHLSDLQCSTLHQTPLVRALFYLSSSFLDC